MWTATAAAKLKDLLLGRIAMTNLGGGGLVAKSCPTLETPWTVACQAPLFMASILKWVVTSFSSVLRYLIKTNPEYKFYHKNP